MENKTHKQVIISGMECAACSAAVERALKRIDGVENASVNLASETATFDFDKSKVDDQKILDTIIKAGFNIVEKSEEQKEIKEKLTQ